VAAVKAVLNQTSAVSQKMDAGIADVEQVIADSQLLLQDPNIPPDMKLEVEQVLNQASARLAKLKAEKQKVVDVLAQYQTILAQVDVNDLTPEQEMQLYAIGAGEASKFLPQPYSGYVFLGLALVPFIGSLLKNINQWRQINDGKRKTTELVISVDKLLSSDQVKDIEQAKIVLQENQSGVTQDLVDAVHSPMENTAPTK